METIIGILVVLVAVALFLLFDMIVACGIIKLTCVCFGLVFSWKMAIGVWLILILISGYFKSRSSKE